MKTISVARLREVLNYDPETGIFTWKTRIAMRSVVGTVAGRINSNGYRRITIFRQSYQAHRLAIAYIEGAFPPCHVDHINGNRLDNRYVNLRHATPEDNQQNRALGRNNASGYVGVHLHKNSGRWMAHIVRQGVSTHLGYFDTPEEANVVRCEAKKQIHTFNPVQR